jgi:hypothetical protein
MYGSGALTELVALGGDEATLRAKYGAKRLAAEFADERARDLAIEDDAALVAYEAKWTRRLTRLFAVHPARWRLPGLSDEELIGELTLRLIEAVRSRSPELAQHHRAGREWSLTFLASARQAIKKGFKLNVVPADLSPLLDRSRPNEEEAYLAKEDAELFAMAKERAEESLSRPQRRWLAAMKMTANAGAFFESSGKLNLAEAARMIDKDRSSAVRAFGELHEHFKRERTKLGE